MLAPAFYYNEELQKEHRKIVYDPKYKYLVENFWGFEIELDNTDEDRLQLVSVTPAGEVLGFFQVDIDRVRNMATSIAMLSFRESSIQFSRDFHQFITDLFEKHHLRKVRFEAILDSPPDKLYFKHKDTYNFIPVGILRSEALLTDGKYHDVRLYELFPK